MRVLIGDIPGGYDAETLHAEIDQAADLKPYAIWWPGVQGGQVRVEIERDVPGAEQIVRGAAFRAAARTQAERERRAARERASVRESIYQRKYGLLLERSEALRAGRDPADVDARVAEVEAQLRTTT